MTIAFRIHPGEILADELEARNLSQKDFAKMIQKSPQEVSFIITGKRNINADWALRLEIALGTEAQFWLNLQNTYDLDLAREEKEKILSTLKMTFATHDTENTLA